LQVGGGEVDAAPVGVGVVVVQPVGARADDAAVDDELFQLKGRLCLHPITLCVISQAIFEVFQDIQLLLCERGFKAVRKADEELILVASRCACDDTNRAAGMAGFKASGVGRGAVRPVTDLFNLQSGLD